MFELALPWVLVALCLPWLIFVMYPKAFSSLAKVVRVPFFDELPVSEDKNQVQGQNWLMVSIWGLVVFALSGPLYIGAPQPVEREGHNILLALDLSSSMQVGDMSMDGKVASRLSVVKRAAKQFVNDRVGDKIGLILFGSAAYLQTPLTYDRQNVLMRIDDATVGLAGGTTSIGDALGLAVKRLQRVPKEGRIVILLTDGANNSGVLSPLKAAELAQSMGVKVYTIGLNSDIDPESFGGMFLQVNAAAELDEDTLKEIAKKTGGRYFRATDLNSLKGIYQTINQMEKVPDEQISVRPKHEYYPWFLALAVGLLIYWLALTAGVFNQLFKRRV